MRHASNTTVYLKLLTLLYCKNHSAACQIKRNKLSIHFAHVTTVLSDSDFKIRCLLVLVLLTLRPELIDINVAIGVHSNSHNLHASHDSRSRVGAMG